MPGEVVKVVVKEGDAVKQGQLIMVLEAMKMLVWPRFLWFVISMAYRACVDGGQGAQGRHRQEHPL